MGGDVRNRTLLILAAALTLAACGSGRSESIAYVADYDAGAGTVRFTCNASSTGRCLFRFEGDTARQVSIAKGESATLGGLDAGASYCALTAANGKCFHQTLMSGRQAIRHEVMNKPG
jgi:hypothetical protein